MLYRNKVIISDNYLRTNALRVIRTGTGNTSFTLSENGLTDTDPSHYLLQITDIPTQKDGYRGFKCADNRYPYVIGATPTLTIEDDTLTISGMAIKGGDCITDIYATTYCKWKLWYIG